MSRRFQAFSAISAALTANALQPISETPLLVPSFFGAWLTTELAPHNLAVTGAVTAAHLAGRGEKTRGDRIAVAVNLASMAGLAMLAKQGHDSRHDVEAALCEALGPDYLDYLDPAPTARDLATPWRDVARPYLLGRSPDVEVVHDIAYGPYGRRNHLDVYRHRLAPVGSPVLLQLHGGAWMIGHKRQQGIALMHYLAAKGWVCVAPNYRLSPRATWPDHLVDTKRALAWVRERIGEYGGDPSFVAVTGGSAGGHLTTMLGLTANDPAYQPGFEDVDTTVQACLPHYGVYDLADVTGSRHTRDTRDRMLAPMVMKQRYAADPSVFEAATPLLLVRPEAPPFFVIHGRHDSLAPVGTAREFVRRLREVSKHPVAYAELPGTHHAFDVFPSIRSSHVLRGVDRFLQWCWQHHQEEHRAAE